jgi:predicted O-linked N-acetylglucosamine transferase (SPINDLY family)
LGAIYFARKNWDVAQKYFVRALKINVKDDIALYNFGLTLHEQGKLELAKQSFEETVKINSEHDSAYNELGTVFAEMDKPSEAIVAFLKAIKINPNNQYALYNLGRILLLQKEPEKAIPHVKKAHKLDPTDGRFVTLLFSHSRSICDWKNSYKYSKILNRLTKKDLSTNKLPGESPFTNVTRIDNPKLNLQVASAYSKDIFEKVLPNQYQHQRPKKKRTKIIIGYVSDGFRDFPTAHNISGILRNHDKSKFEIHAYSFGPNDKSSQRKNIARTVTKFNDLYGSGAFEIAEKIYNDKIDILIDLKGFTRGSFPEIAALKPAQIIISYLGFVGSTGSTYHDYFVGDKITITPNIRKYFSEKIIYMPDTYWPTDDKLQISNAKFQRKDFGIP